jgi:hypothetical protein
MKEVSHAGAGFDSLFRTLLAVTSAIEAIKTGGVLFARDQLHTALMGNQLGLGTATEAFL